MYLDAEVHDGYRRDQDVFGPGITIEDTMSVLVDYRRGATLTYSLNAHAPWEGYKVTVNGTKGRAELEVVERGSVEFDASGRAVLDPSAREAESAPKAVVANWGDAAAVAPLPRVIGRRTRAACGARPTARI